MTEQEHKEYYSNLLIFQYNNKEKAKQTIELLASVLYVNNIPYDMRNKFDLDTAVGAQLDVIGKYVGVDRFYTSFDLGDDIFGLVEYDEIAVPPTTREGFTDYANFDDQNGTWLRYTDMVSNNNILNDDDYRIILKLKIIQNNSNHSVGSIDESLFQFFGDTVTMVDNKDMTMTYTIPIDASAIITVAVQKDVLPRPMGVETIIVEV